MKFLVASIILTVSYAKAMPQEPECVRIIREAHLRLDSQFQFDSIHLNTLGDVAFNTSRDIEMRLRAYRGALYVIAQYPKSPEAAEQIGRLIFRMPMTFPSPHIRPLWRMAMDALMEIMTENPTLPVERYGFFMPYEHIFEMAFTSIEDPQSIKANDTLFALIQANPTGTGNRSELQRQFSYLLWMKGVHPPDKVTTPETYMTLHQRTAEIFRGALGMSEEEAYNYKQFQEEP